MSTSASDPTVNRLGPLTGRPILFLDCDGSGLNGHERHPNGYCGSRPDVVARLNRVIAATDCVLVVTSAWRYLVHSGQMTVLGLESLLLTHGVAAHCRVAAVTRRDAAPEDCDRGRQVADWLVANAAAGPGRYAVLDDLELDIPVHGHPFVHVAGGDGMDDAAAALIALLAPDPR